MNPDSPDDPDEADEAANLHAIDLAESGDEEDWAEPDLEFPDDET